MKIIRINISGRVQGVCFRANAQKQADKLDITGFVRNKHDGAVEVIACADQKKLDDLISWCHRGPMMAKVAEVKVSKCNTTETFINFEIR